MFVCRSKSHRLYFLAHLSLINLFALTAALPAQAAPTLQWIRQFGTDTNDRTWSVSVDPFGSIFVGGGNAISDTQGFLGKFDLAGHLHWMRQFDSGATRIASSDLLGNVVSSGRYNSHVEKYDAFGNLLWSRDSDPLSIHDVTVGSLGNLFVSSYYLLRKLDSSGNTVWTRLVDWQGGASHVNISADRVGNSFVVGTTGLFPNSDGYVLKYSPAGDLLWNRAIATSEADTATAVAVDAAGNVFVAGFTRGNLGPDAVDAHGTDAFLRKLDPSGDVLWTRQYGGQGPDSAYGLTVDRIGNAYITGITNSAYFGSYSGSTDAFVAKVDPAGDLLWSHEFGTAATEWSYDISVDALGNIVLGGRTNGELGGPNAGDYDAWVALFRENIPGDFSGDGLINNADLTLLLNHWGDAATPAPAGWTGHLPTAPAIDNSELTALLNAWGQGTLAQATGATQMPEPTSAFLLLSAAIALFAGRRGARPPRPC